MTRFLIAYGGALTTLLVLDLLWLGVVMRGFYRAALAPIMREQPLWVPAILFYALYAVGLVWFATAPAMEDGQWTRALWAGAAFGLFAYLTYDMTNYATLKAFPLRMVLVDVAWGVAVSGAAALAGWYAAHALDR